MEGLNKLKLKWTMCIFNCAIPASVEKEYQFTLEIYVLKFLDSHFIILVPGEMEPSHLFPLHTLTVGKLINLHCSWQDWILMRLVKKSTFFRTYYIEVMHFPIDRSKGGISLFIITLLEGTVKSWEAGH